MLSAEQLKEFIATQASGAVDVYSLATPFTLTIADVDLPSIALSLYQDSRTYFDMLSCITGVDNGPEAGTFEVIYHLYSIPYNQHLGLRVVIPRDNARIQSVTSIWRTADWHEREAFDMFGIVFEKHPDMRRILMPADWEGHPLRKDYKQQAYYRNIKLEY